MKCAFTIVMKTTLEYVLDRRLQAPCEIVHAISKACLFEPIRGKHFAVFGCSVMGTG